MTANGSLASEYTLITVHNCASPTYIIQTVLGSNVCSFFGWRLTCGLEVLAPCSRLCTREVQHQSYSHTKFVSLSTVRHPLLNLVIAIITSGKKCVQVR